MPHPEMHQHVGAWMSGAGSDSDVVISSRVRLARNVAGHRFVSRASLEERSELAAQLRAAVDACVSTSDKSYFNMETLSALNRQMLVERHLISRELAEGEGPRGVMVAAGETLSVMINEEDHLRMQCLQGGLNVDAAWDALDAFDNAVEGHVAYAFDTRLGYLTACPTNVGTGMRVSVMLHLPALSMTRELQRVFAAAAKIDFIVRGLYGEGTQGQGDFYQVSNQKTLGRSEREILDNLNVVIPQIIRYERKVRTTLFNEHRPQVEDRVWRAYGLLTHARVMSSDEAMHLLSQIRLGATLGILTTVDLAAVNRLFILSRPAHLQKMTDRELDAQDRDRMRAEFLRQSIAGETQSGLNDPIQ